jgi:O-antigen/teichoic acid export membrane protein
MTVAYREILKHSAIYGVGQVLSRLASFLLLPLYTSYLRPADYGCLAILDLTSTLLGTLVGSGMAATANRFHFDSDDDRHRDRVWWTALTLLVVAALLVVTPCWFARDLLTRVSLGRAQPAGPFYYALVLPTLCLTALGEFLFQYLRVRKWSGLTVVLSMGDLLLRIGLNVYFLVGLHLGMVGILWSNLLVTGTTGLVVFALFVASRGRYCFDVPLARHLWRFGMPLMFTTMLAIVMYQANRYVLNLYADLAQVGIYSLAYAIAQGVYGLLANPFTAIWGAVVYEIAAHRDAKAVYHVVFKYYAYVVALLLFGLSLFARPILALMTAADYSEAAGLIPILSLACFFSSLHTHFSVPALLAKKTVHLMPAVAVAATFNLTAPFLLVPRFGYYGAAWACVGTYALFSFTGLAVYRRIDRYEYPLVRCAMVLAGMGACCVVMRLMDQMRLSMWVLLCFAAMIWTAWAAALLGRPTTQAALGWWHHGALGPWAGGPEEAPLERIAAAESRLAVQALPAASPICAADGELEPEYP